MGARSRKPKRQSKRARGTGELEDAEVEGVAGGLTAPAPSALAGAQHDAQATLSTLRSVDLSGGEAADRDDPRRTARQVDNGMQPVAPKPLS